MQPTAQVETQSAATPAAARAALLAAGPVLFFDGNWGLCTRVVNRVAMADRAGRLRFAPLQGSTAAQALPPPLVADLATAVLLDAAGTHLRSEALLRVWGALPWPWRLLACLRAVPPALRDGVYRLVAAHRQRLRLGALEWHGPLPPAQQARFLP